MKTILTVPLLLISFASSLAARPAATHPRPSKCESCARNSKGRIKRSASAKRAFESQHPCPSTGKTTGACPGYVVDHIKPLKRGGPDIASNMQWQRTAEAKAKDRVED